jgi:hypothetical protein
MSKIKKILFPFFNKERHSFLNKKWWSRVIMTLYVSGLIIVTVAIFFPSYNIQTKLCRNHQDFTQEQSKKIYQDAKSKGLDAKKVIYLMAKQGAVFDGADMKGILEYGKTNYEPKKESIGIKETLANIFSYSYYEDKDCGEIAKREITTGILVVIIITTVAHYLIQLVFFKIILDYIVLNYSNNKKS